MEFDKRFRQYNQDLGTSNMCRIVLGPKTTQIAFSFSPSPFDAHYATGSL